MMKKLWQGRFSKGMDCEVETFTECVSLDARLYEYDITGSLAHTNMLCARGYLSKAERDRIHRALKAIGRDIAAGKLSFGPADEDIHMAVESELIKRVGDVGRKVHTARSRNDQISTDVRLYMRDEIDALLVLVRRLQKALLKQARAGRRTIVPGYTHLQQAQPVFFGQHMLAYISMFSRDRERLEGARGTVDRMPLGACAMAGTSLDIDRCAVQKELGFGQIMTNSMDAVSSRDHILETLSAIAIMGVNMSRLCEELVLWSSQEFNFIRIGDEFCTGSSIMPQKKNPDVAELVRGKTGRLFGSLVSMLTIMKGLPLCYNRDMQEDKGPLFDAIDTAKASLSVLGRMIDGMSVNEAGIKAAVKDDFLLATDLAEFLVEKGLPFRNAHHVVGAIVGECAKEGKNIRDLGLDGLRRHSPLFDGEAVGFLTLEASVNRKKSLGSTAGREIDRQIKQTEKELKD